MCLSCNGQLSSRLAGYLSGLALISADCLLALSAIVSHGLWPGYCASAGWWRLAYSLALQCVVHVAGYSKLAYNEEASSVTLYMAL